MTPKFDPTITGSRSTSATAATRTVEAGKKVAVTIGLRCSFMETVPRRSKDSLIKCETGLNENSYADAWLS